MQLLTRGIQPWPIGAINKPAGYRAHQIRLSQRALNMGCIGFFMPGGALTKSVVPGMGEVDWTVSGSPTIAIKNEGLSWRTDGTAGQNINGTLPIVLTNLQNLTVVVRVANSSPGGTALTCLWVGDSAGANGFNFQQVVVTAVNKWRFSARVGGTANNSDITYGGGGTNVFGTLGMSVNDSTHFTGYLDGVSGGLTSLSGTLTGLTLNTVRVGARPGSGNGSFEEIPWFFIFERTLSDIEHWLVARQPWSLIEPVPVRGLLGAISKSPNLSSASITGAVAGTSPSLGKIPPSVSATGAVASFSIIGNVSKSLSAVAATGHAASVVATNSPSLHTVTVTGTVVAFAKKDDKPLTSAAITGHAGTFLPIVGIFVNLQSAAITGHAAAFTVGLSPNIPISGVHATGTVAQVIPTFKPPFPAVSVLGAVGGFLSNETHSLSAVSVTGAVAAIIQRLSPLLAPVAITGSVANFSQTHTHSLTAVAATGHAAAIVATEPIALHSVAAIGVVESFGISRQPSLFPVAAIGHVAAIIAANMVNITGVEIVGAVGDFVPYIQNGPFNPGPMHSTLIQGIDTLTGL